MSIKSKLFFTLFVSGFLFLSAQNKIKETLPGTSQSLDLVYIKGGTFTMGSPKSEAGHFGDEGPSHEVTVEDFWMGQYEITWDLYNLFVSREIDAFQSKKNPTSEVQIDVDAVSGATTPYVEMSFGMGTEGYPAISMTQLAAKKFCQWLSAMTGNFYRLPTEAEWEYACRAESESPYYFGNDSNDLDKYGWYKNNSNNKYQKVGLKLPNKWGLYDMHGNVSEWTLDAYDTSFYSNSKNEIDNNPYNQPEKLYPRVVRGGS